MYNVKLQRVILIALSVFVVTAFFTQCTKDGVNASQISRALVSTPDSTVFSPFYDSTIVSKPDFPLSANDVIKTNGVRNIIRSNCASAACHGGGIAPTLLNYSQIAALVSPGNPAGSVLFDLITTNDNHKAMPPINYGVDLSLTEKVKIYNWIKNGAKESPDLVDYRSSAISMMTNGCASGNCHNAATLTADWAKKGWFAYTANDTFLFAYQNPATGLYTNYTQLKDPLMSQVWGAYKDSVKKFYADTLANASFRPWKTMGTPTTIASRRGPLNTYDDIIMDIMYPKNIRSNSAIVYTDPVTLKKYYTKGDYFNSNDCFMRRMDSTIVYYNVRTKVATTPSGNMAWDDGGLSPSEVALFKQWYFSEPNIPNAWKYGLNNEGIFMYKKTGKWILP